MPPLEPALPPSVGRTTLVAVLTAHRRAARPEPGAPPGLDPAEIDRLAATLQANPPGPMPGLAERA